MFPVHLLLALAIYFVPTVIASMRKVDRPLVVYLVNLLLGWTGIGWLVSLILACSRETKQQRMYREIAEERLHPVSASAEPSASLGAGRVMGSAVRKLRGDYQPPPSIR